MVVNKVYSGKQANCRSGGKLVEFPPHLANPSMKKGCTTKRHSLLTLNHHSALQELLNTEADSEEIELKAGNNITCST